jgi:hypothetical protein
MSGFRNVNSPLPPGGENGEAPKANSGDGREKSEKPAES